MSAPASLDSEDLDSDLDAPEEPLERRQDPAVAAGILTRLLPDAETRRAVLGLMADAIRENHAVNPANWGVTLNDSAATLNIGGGFVCLRIRSGRVMYFHDPLPSQVEDQELIHPFETPGLTDVILTEIASNVVTSRPGEVDANVLSFVKRTATRYSVLNAQIRRAHSPGVLRYIEQELALPEPLPDPQYPTDAAPGTRRYWRVGTREGQERIDRWPAMRDGKFISIGWSGMGDLRARSEGKDRQTVVAELSAYTRPYVRNQNRATANYYARAWYAFFADARPGDLIAAMDGGRLLGVGVLIGEYVFDAGDSLQPHHRQVEWEWFGDNHTWKDYPGKQTTFFEFTNNAPAVQYVSSLLGGTTPPPVSLPTSENPETAMPSAALNTILYGPPGTGKTYATALRAVRIIDGDAAWPDTRERADVMARYRDLEREGRIAFVTFHQSYGYEEFVEGIRPVMDDAEADGAVRYEVRDGRLKEVATAALAACLEATDEPGPRLSFDTLWQAFLERLEEEPDIRGVKDIIYRTHVTSNDGLHATNAANAEGKGFYAVSRESMARVWQALGHQSTVTRSDVKAVFGGKEGDHNFKRAIFAALKELEPTLPPSDEADEKPTDADARDYLTSGDVSGYRLIPDPAARPRYVLIVDEINRGNVSKVLGELITLLEDDKRIGEENALTVTLPYSRERFGLPPNLYVIGTMNSADKSIALVDVALRRRFDFEELTPDFSSPAVCPDLTDEMRAALIELNKRITLRLDRDHRIGHAPFVRVAEEAGFDRVFRRKVLPLLQEYFYNDWDGLRFVLGETGSGDGAFLCRLEGHGLSGAHNRWQWRTDVGEALTPLASLTKNYGPNA